MRISDQKQAEFNEYVERFNALDPFQIQLQNLEFVDGKALKAQSKTAFLNKFEDILEELNEKVAKEDLNVDISGDSDVNPLTLVLGHYQDIPDHIKGNFPYGVTDLEKIEAGLMGVEMSIASAKREARKRRPTDIQGAILDRLLEPQRIAVNMFSKLLRYQEEAEVAQAKQKRKKKQQQVEPPPPTQDVDFELTPPTEPPPKAPKSTSKAFYGIVGSFGQIVQSVEAYETSTNAEPAVVSALNSITVSPTYLSNAFVELDTLISNLSVVMQSYGLQGIVEVNAFPSFTGALDVIVDDSPTSSSSDYSVSIDSTLNSDGEYEDSIVEEIAIGIFQYLNLVNPQIEEVGLSELDLAFMLKGQI